MTQVDIYAMDKIVDHLGAGMKLSEALSRVYRKRSVAIPYNETDLSVLIETLGMTTRTSNALMRSHLTSLGDVVKYNEVKHIKTIPYLGTVSARETMETILNYCWDHMTAKQKETFLIDVVLRNSENLREDFLDI